MAIRITWIFRSLTLFTKWFLVNAMLHIFVKNRQLFSSKYRTNWFLFWFIKNSQVLTVEDLECCHFMHLARMTFFHIRKRQKYYGWFTICRIKMFKCSYLGRIYCLKWWSCQNYLEFLTPINISINEKIYNTTSDIYIYLTLRIYTYHIGYFDRQHPLYTLT